MKKAQQALEKANDACFEAQTAKTEAEAKYFFLATEVATEAAPPSADGSLYPFSFSEDQNILVQLARLSGFPPEAIALLSRVRLVVPSQA